jgi:excisionase family DNA binding protein
MNILKSLQRLLRIQDNTPDSTTEINSQGDIMENEIDTRQAAQQYHVSENYIRRMIREGKIKGRKLRRDWLVDVASLGEYMTAGRKWARKKPK